MSLRQNTHCNLLNHARFLADPTRGNPPSSTTDKTVPGRAILRRDFKTIPYPAKHPEALPRRVLVHSPPPSSCTGTHPVEPLAGAKHSLQRSLVLESRYWTSRLSAVAHKPFALVRHSSSSFCQHFSMWTPVRIATWARTALQILPNKFGNTSPRAILVSISVIATTRFERFLQVEDAKLQAHDVLQDPEMSFKILPTTYRITFSVIVCSFYK